MIFPIAIDGSVNQGSSDRFFNREIEVALKNYSQSACLPGCCACFYRAQDFYTLYELLY